jgi:hypothetical protein
MADIEVEETLREIRERVRASAPHLQAPQPATAGGIVAAPESLDAERYAPGDNGRAGDAAADALSRMEANLSTTERAWSRLPPLLSNRKGWTARLELWVKRKIKRAAHWFTWEQVNFNSSVHNALRDARATLALHEQLLQRMQSESATNGASLRQLRAEAEAERSRVNSRLLELGARLAAAQAKFDAGAAQLHQQLSSSVEQLSSSIEQLRAEQREHSESLRAEQDASAGSLRVEQQQRLAEFENEVRERFSTILDEQRVCFRQLSLEAAETEVMNDRARRLLEARLEALETNEGKSEI